jgi:hypothetical protein
VHGRGYAILTRSVTEARPPIPVPRLGMVVLEQSQRVSGNVRFQGRDDNGKAWQAILPIDGGIGFTTIWQADFDRNSRPDILIAAYFPKNGRCIDEITLSFLLFDLHGRPIPWVIQTRMPTTKRFPLIPAIFSSHNDRTELVVTDCEFGASALLGQDRSITGIYEARDARWNLVRPTRLDAYRDLVRHRYRFTRTPIGYYQQSPPIGWIRATLSLRLARFK